MNGRTPTSSRPTATPFDAFAVSIDPGVVLVEASAGTGKTFGITMTVLRLLLEEHPDGRPVVDGIGNILVVTFTKPATNELITRIRAGLRLAHDVLTGTADEESDTTTTLRQFVAGRESRALERIRGALATVDKLSVFTIHGFCKRVLDEFALESRTPFGAALLTEDDDIVQSAMEDWWRRTMYLDEALAGFAASQELAPTSFAADFKKWRCLPETAIEPNLSIETAKALVAEAQHELARSLQGFELGAYLESITWLSTVALKDASVRQQVVRAGEAAATGSLADASIFAKHCAVDALQKGAGKKSKEARARHDAIPDQLFVQAASKIEEALTALLGALRVSCLSSVAATLTAEKVRRNALGFDDLLISLRDALREDGSEGLLAAAIRRQYQAALIDEFQDTDPYQFPIFSTAFKGCPLFLIGDPKQAIYGFRGADVFAYLSAAATASRAHTLTTNWRSTAAMVGAVNGLFGRRANPFLYSQIGYNHAQAANRRATDELATGPLNDGKAALHWWFLPPGDGANASKASPKGAAFRTIANMCVREIVCLLQNGAAAREIAVLVRSGKEGLQIEELLRVANVPAVVSGMGDILQSSELRELHLIMRAVAAPRDFSMLRAAFSTQLWGASHQELVQWASTGGEPEWDARVDDVDALRQLWVDRGFLAFAQRLLSAQRVVERLMPLADGERRLTNLRHAIELIHAASAVRQLGVDALLHWIASETARPTEDREVTELRLESDADAVQIVTIHKSKGLEYDVVFCPSLWSTYGVSDDEAVVVHTNTDGVVFDHGSPQRATRGQLAQAERLAEDLRLTYVALTRARRRTYVAWGPIQSKARAASWNSGLAYLMYDAAWPEAQSVEEAVATTAALWSADLDNWQARLETLVKAHPKCMSFQLADGARAEVFTPAPTASPEHFAARGPLPTASHFDTWGITSYTALATGAKTDVARDVADETAGVASSSRVQSSTADRSDFSAFPAGRRPGVVLHELFEHADFAASTATLRTSVSRTLRKFAMVDGDSDLRIAAVTDMMGRVFASPIGTSTFALGDVAPERTLREWEFLLPLGTVQRFTFADIFARHGGASGASYAPLLRQLAGRRIHGFLKGFVDLVFEHEGRWYVVDWKSNQLGRDRSAYSPDALKMVMHESHYTLQYHLYVVALHRFLRARLPSYSYETHMGGAAYAFLRGFTDAGHGWYVDRPSLELVTALDELMDAGRVLHTRGAA